MISMKPKLNKLAVKLNLQNPMAYEDVPSRYFFQRWVETALTGRRKKATEIAIRIVDELESAELNQTYRRKMGPTNILSFPFEPPPGIKLPILGDLVICAPIVAKEAAEQNKTLPAHWAHMVIHGVLHLLGYDHVKEAEALIMENLEIKLLDSLGFTNPYLKM